MGDVVDVVDILEPLDVVYISEPLVITVQENGLPGPIGPIGPIGPPGPPVELSLNPYNALRFDQEGKLFCPAVQSGLTDW